MSLKTMKAAELIFDWNLWPRSDAEDLDSTHMRRLKEAIKIGEKMPPVIANKKDYRLVDGFHRTRAMLDLYGSGAKIDAELKEYKSDAEMLLDSAKYNAKHGIPLTPKDRVHFIIKARKYKIPLEATAQALGMEPGRITEFFKQRTATNRSGERVALPYGSSALAGKKLTEKQEHYTKTANGTLPIVHARILLNALKAEAIVLNEAVYVVLIELHEKLDEVLKEHQEMRTS